ncbi:MAG: hypothetical protein R3E95_12775 [Thiolinea sp.]
MKPVFEHAADWLAYDRAHLWHPYTSMVDPLPCYPVASAQECAFSWRTGARLLTAWVPGGAPFMAITILSELRCARKAKKWRM